MSDVRVVIKCYSDPEYRHVVSERASERHAERVVRGIMINLGENYYVDEEPVE